MRKNIVFLILLTTWALSGCAVLQGASSQPGPADVAASPTSSDYVAPTLPPVYTKTPTASPEPTPEPSPTPFTIVAVESETPQVTQDTAIPTPVFTFSRWERFEANRFDLALNVPDTLQATVFGQNIVIASPSSAEVSIPLDLELRVDRANSFRLPDGINPDDPRSVLEAILNEIEAEYDSVTLIRPLSNTDVNGKPASEAAARTILGEGDSAQETLWYLAVIVNEGTVVRVYASAPAETGSAYLVIAERITDSLEFLPEP
jgi:hypothetical protein